MQRTYLASYTLYADLADDVLVHQARLACAGVCERAGQREAVSDATAGRENNRAVRSRAPGSQPAGSGGAGGGAGALA